MLYRVASVVVYGNPEWPRINLTVRLCSDTVVLTGRPILRETVPLVLPTEPAPRAWLGAALRQTL